MTPDNDLHWYVAYVRSCGERKAAETLAAAGVETYLPIQKEIRQWSDRKKLVERLVLPHMIFVRCTVHDRVKTLEQCSYLTRYMSNKGPYNPVVVPDIQLEAFRCMVERGGRQVSAGEELLVPGDRVRITSGPLAGLECELVKVGERRCIAVRLGGLVTARMDLERETIEKINE